MNDGWPFSSRLDSTQRSHPMSSAFYLVLAEHRQSVNGPNPTVASSGRSAHGKCRNHPCQQSFSSRAFPQAGSDQRSPVDGQSSFGFRLGALFAGALEAVWICPRKSRKCWRFHWYVPSLPRYATPSAPAVGSIKTSSRWINPDFSTFRWLVRPWTPSETCSSLFETPSRSSTNVRKVELSASGEYKSMRVA